MIVGGLTWLIATLIAANEWNRGPYGDTATLAGAGAWQGLGGWAIVIGLLALIGALIAGSIGYDIRFASSTPSAAEDPEAVDS